MASPADQNQFKKADMTAPIDDAVAMVKGAADLPYATRAIYVGTAGDVEVKMKSGNVVMFKSMPVGWHPIRCLSITNNTAASNIVGGF